MGMSGLHNIYICRCFICKALICNYGYIILQVLTNIQLAPSKEMDMATKGYAYL